MATGPGDEPVGAGRDRLRAGHADREQVIGTLKAAFVQGMLAKDEFDARVSQAFASRTCAELAAVTADLPAGLAAAASARPPAPARRRPMARAAARSGGFLAFGMSTSLEQRRSRGQLPPGPGPGGHGPDVGQSSGPSRSLVPPRPGAGQARADLRPHKPPQRIPARAARTPRGLRPVQGTPGIPAPVPRAT
jgi:hypothetical protein